MAKKSKKELTKKVKEVEEPLVELEEDQSSSSFEAIFEKYKAYIYGALAVIVLGIAGVLYYQYNMRQQNVEAEREMFRAVQYFEADSFALALNGNGVNYGFYDIVDEYSGTSSANLANYYIGVILLSQDSAQVEEGIEYLEAFDKPSGSILSASAYRALGFAYEDLGEYDRAASQFESAARAFDEDNEFVTPELLIHAGRNYESAGKLDKARSTYLRVKEQFPLSTEGINIEKYLGRVSESQ